MTEVVSVSTANRSEFIGAALKAIESGKGAKFASVLYTAKTTGEVARHTIVLGASTETLYEKDITMLTEMMADDNLSPVERIAVAEMLASRRESLDKGIGHNSQYVHAPENADTYVITALAGIKVHKETGEFHVSGLAVSKDVITPGREINRRGPRNEVTAAKNAVRAKLPSSRFRQFVIDASVRWRLNGETIEMEG